MKPFIKWPGGKSGQIDNLKDYIPGFDRYIEPFFGSGALFFYLEPQKSAINDISPLLMEFYRLIKERDAVLHGLLLSYDRCFSLLYELCVACCGDIRALYDGFFSRGMEESEFNAELGSLVFKICASLKLDPAAELILDDKAFAAALSSSALCKMKRTAFYDADRSFTEADIKNSLITGFMGGFYKYFRGVYNLINSGKAVPSSPQYRAANFYFIREFCYGSMFRYNSEGCFNIPYGGMTYNKKKLRAKIDNMFSEKTAGLLSAADIHCRDFESFLDKVSPGKGDFIFLDPPYDSDFSDYEGRVFGKSDHERLASLLKKSCAKIMLVIERTAFIQNLYCSEGFNIRAFESRYIYNVKSRNERAAEYLMITNFAV